MSKDSKQGLNNMHTEMLSKMNVITELKYSLILI
jgi:hypothetical protein